MNNYLKIDAVRIIVCLMLLLLAGCGSDEDPDPDDDNPPTISSITPDSGPVGTSVTITGTNFSATASNNSVTVNGVSANVNSSTTTSITFTVPATATTGNVVVTVDGQSATGPVFTVEEDNSGAIVYDCNNSDITESVTWEDHVPGNDVDYIIKCEIVVKGTALLTIEPGVVIEFEGELAGIFTDESGGLKAVGTQENPIQFLGTGALRGVWKGVYFGTTHPENRLEYVTVSHAGRTASGVSGEKGAVQLSDDENSEGAIVNCNIINNEGYGVVITDESTVTSFSGNTINNNESAPVLVYFNQLGALDNESDYQNNGENYIEVRENTLEENNVDVVNPGIPYRFIDPVKYYILDDLTIAPGVVLEFVQGSGFRLGDRATDCAPASGTLNATGTEAEMIVFKGVTAGRGTWLGIGFNSSSPNNKLIYCDISGGGGGKIFNNSNVKNANVALTCESQVTIQNAMIHESGGYGISVHDADAVLDEFKDNTVSNNDLAPVNLHFPQLGMLDDSNSFSDGNGSAYIEVVGTKLTENDLTIIKLDVSYRLFTDNLGRETYIEKNLVIAPGVIIEFETGTGIILGSPGVDCIPKTGSINADGTAEDKIIFRGANDGQGTWIGIGINSGSSANVFDFVEISGGGSEQLYNAGGQGNIVLHCEGKLTLTNSDIRDSGGWGVDFVNVGTLSESDNTFDNNSSGDIHN